MAGLVVDGVDIPADVESAGGAAIAAHVAAQATVDAPARRARKLAGEMPVSGDAPAE